MGNSLYLGSAAVDSVYLGSTKADKVYLGSTLVWSASVTTTATVATTADDGYARTSPSADFETMGPLLGQVSGSNYRGFARFSTVHIPPGATISQASITLTGTCTVSAGLATSVYGQAADNPTTPTTASDVVGRALTTANVPWAISNGAPFTTPDISAVIQEIVNRPGWASGNALLIFFVGSGSWQQVAPNKAGTLTVTYS